MVKRTRRNRGQIILSEVDGDLLHNLFRFGLTDLIGLVNITDTLDDALARAAELVSKPNRP